MSITSYVIRALLPSDQAFLWEMLYQALYVPPGAPPYPRDVLDRPDVRKYGENWGRPGDLGFVAIDSNSGEPVGAVWLRLLTGDERGYGYVDDETPELGIAVLPEHRGQAIGYARLSHLLKSATAYYPSISLSVSPDNRAVHLYERSGFRPVGGTGTSMTMIKFLNANATG